MTAPNCSSACSKSDSISFINRLPLSVKNLPICIYVRRSHSTLPPHLEEQDEAAQEGVKVEGIVQPELLRRVHEEVHAHDGVDEHDQDQQQRDVEECRQRHGQREEQGPDAFSRLDQTQDATHAEHSDHT